MKVVMIIADTFRYDHLGFTGHKMVETPELDALARESFFFDNARIASFPTMPNREDTNTGKYTFPHHGWGSLPDTAIPLAQPLTQAGYTTQLLTDTPHLIGRGHRYHRGFQGYHWIRGNEGDCYFTRYNKPIPNAMPREKTRADEKYFGDHVLADLQYWLNPNIVWEEEFFVARTAKMASRWIEENYKADNFFLWVDTFECHEPWSPPDYYVERYDPDYKGDFLVTYPVYGSSACYTPAELQNMKACYAGVVSLTSKWLGHIVHKLKDVGIYDDTLVIFTSDHGTYIGDQGRAGKMNMAGNPKREIPWAHYEGVNHVPLIVKMPGQTEGARVKAHVQPVDLFPTILDLGGVKHDLPLDGLSWKPLLTGGSENWPRKYSFSSPVISPEPTFWTTITGEGHTLSLGGETGDKPLLYNIADDPEQTKNLAEERKDIVREMGGAYIAFLKQVGSGAEKIEVFEKKIKRFAS